MLTPYSERIFAIPLSETVHRKWTDEADTAQLQYRWDDIAIPGTSKKDEILTATAQQYSETDPDEVRGIASDIYQYARLKDGDSILGYYPWENTGKTGVITQFSSDSYGIQAEISWKPLDIPVEAILEALDGDLGIQKITPRFIDKAVAISKRKSNGANDLLYELSPPSFKSLDKAGLESGSSRTPSSAKKDAGGAIELFYGTNRNCTGVQKASEFYDGELGTLKLGQCEVSIPPGHRRGELERPYRVRILGWQFNENKNRHVVLSSVRELPEAAFTALLQAKLTQSPEKSALVFIHGYNTSFAEAAWRTGQLAYDLPFDDGVTCFFSWPSTAKTVDYIRDEDRAEASVGDLVQFIEVLVQQAGIEHLHFVAHSMGNRILTRALNVLATRPSFQHNIGSICQIVLAAPDIDRDVFAREIMPAFQAIGMRRTLYSSDQDKAMRISRTLRRGLPRIGEAGDHLYVTAGLDTIDASNVLSHGNHHSYVFECKELLADVYALITQNLEPQQRRLRLRSRGALDYWLFPE